MARKRHGPPPFPRRRLNPKLYAAVRASSRPAYQLAVLAGLTHGTVLSALIRAEDVPDTPLTRERLQRIADLVGFDKAQLFLDSGQ